MLHSLMDALAVSEFLATFSAVCGAPQLNLAQLQQAVAWPLDGPELFEVYTVLVKYLLAQWVSAMLDIIYVSPVDSYCVSFSVVLDMGSASCPAVSWHIDQCSSVDVEVNACLPALPYILRVL